MEGRGRRRVSSRRRKRKNRWMKIAAGAAAFLVTGAALTVGIFWWNRQKWETPQELLVTYMNHIPNKEYEEMYDMIGAEVSGGITREEFTERNRAIYEGIGACHLKVEVIDYEKEQMAVTYQTSMETAAGMVSFENKAYFFKGEESYLLVWEDGLIFPELGPEDKVRVSVTEAERGAILDRNGHLLAGKGTASSVGMVPGRLEDREAAVSQAAGLLGMKPEDVEKKLAAKWVKEDYFVPIKTIPKVAEIALMAWEPEEETLKEKERQEALLAIPGVLFSDTEIRTYPYGEAAAHLIGYVQNVTAEDLEKHAGEGYRADSVIGRTGMEGLFEKELKGEDGCRIYISDREGKEKKELAKKPVNHGRDIQLTIDAELQEILYEQFREDKGCHVAMNPYTGQVLALVSTPSYDNNDFIFGMSEEEWMTLNEDEKNPLYNRFRQTWCPGSAFKPITAAVGLGSGAIDPAQDFGQEGKSWQKDESWGAYYVTTLHTYEPVTLENALIYSDNIYFAKAALKIGAKTMEDALQRLGFGDGLPFEMKMAVSQYSNTEHIETEIQLADSGYGQGQMLVNPLHMACIYSAFCNEGNMIKPCLLYQKKAGPEIWISEAFSADTAERVKESLIKVINDPQGTGYGARREDVLLAGKTGTAEIKASKEDRTGTELGWFTIFTAEKETGRPILIVSMVEDVKGRGGSGYVVERQKQVLEEWFA